MIKFVRTFALLFAAGILTGCLSSNDSFVTSNNGIAASTNASVSSILLLASSPQLGSSGATSVTITAIVKDSANLVMDAVPVVFTADSGSLAVTQGTTDASGQAIATLTSGGDFTNRTITLTATAGAQTQSTTIDVTGTSISISGENTVTIGDSTVLTMVLTDSDGQAIAGKTVTVTSALGNTLSAAILSTDSAGQIQVTVTADNAGSDTISVTAQGATATHSLSISADQFQITAPAVNADVNLGTCQAIQLSWQSGGVPQNGKTISFSATRGAIYADNACTTTATSAVTNSSGLATVYIKSANAGQSTLTAFVSGGPTTSKAINFVATTAAFIDLQVDKATIGPNDGSQSVQQQATITVTIRDPSNNLVKGKVVRFSITQDVSGGTLSTATATTDALGRAATTYISSAATTAKNGVTITAFVEDTPAVTGSINLTVAQSGLFVRLGTANNVAKIGATLYNKQYTVIVTDASGNAVANKSVNISINPEQYGKGSWTVVGSNWIQNRFLPTCPNEDVNENGILDSGEDINNNGTLEPGNIASSPSLVTTGVDGTFEFDIIYPREFAEWVYVRVTASTQVAGTESSDTVKLWLPIAAADVKDITVSPPGQASPFGVQVGCNNTN